MADNQLDELKHYILLHGGNPNINKLPLDHKLKEYAKNISEMHLEQYDGIELPYIHKFQVFHGAKQFMGQNFQLHPIGWLPTRRLKRILNNHKIHSPLDVARLYNKAGKMVDPMDLPVDFTIPNIFGGRLSAQTVITDDSAFLEEMFPHINLYFQKILLSSTLTPVTTTNYVHELTHTQLESQKGVIEQYYNGEFLSVFLEFVHAYETNPAVFSLDYLNRLQHILVNFYSMFMHNANHPNPEREYTELDYYKDSRYTVSIVNAIAMLQYYLKSDDKMKKYIMKQIQAVFDGKMTVEDLLKKFDISFEDSLDPEIPKKILKHII